MDYTLDIIDTINDSLVLSLERALRGSIVLDWQGSDRKDDLTIVGSSLSFTMVAKVQDDGVYYDLFTGDETRFRCRLYDSNDTTIWSGFILPDQYSEPYENIPKVKFMATDGLGRLKGKYLSDDFYEEEKSVIEIIATCLKLTGLGLDFRFSPAIENSLQKDYNQIWINTEEYKDEDKKEDAYTILEELLESMFCAVYQADNYYNIEGLNIREQRVYSTKVYDSEGVFIEEQQITRNYKSVTGLATPDITMIPPIGTLTVTREKELFGLSEGLSSEENDGWTYRTQTIATYTSTRTEDKESLIYVSDWFGQNGFFAYSGVDENVFFTTESLSGGEGQRITPRNRKYISEGKKYKLKFEFEIVPTSDDEEVNKVLIRDGKWQDPFDFEIGYFTYPEDGYEVIIANRFLNPDDPKKYPLNFGNGDKKTITVDFQFIPKYSGEFIFTINPLKSNIGVDKVLINEMDLTLIGEEEEIVISDTLTEGWTTTKEIELEYGGGTNGLEKEFRLHRLKEPYNETTIELDIIRRFQYKGKDHLSLPLYAVNLIDENRDALYQYNTGNTNKLSILVFDIIYNYHNSDEHVVLVQPGLTLNDGKIYVDIYDYGYAFENREYWNEWTDSIYKVERNPYEQTVYNLNSRLLDKELPSMRDFTVKNNVKFNDFIGFNYKDTRDWVVTNCKWDIDRGFTDFDISRRYYISEGNYDPIVELGRDIYIEPDQTEFTIFADAFDPDGFISSYKWEAVLGGPYIYMWDTTTDTLTVRLFNENFHQFQVTVTDNDGNTATDIVSVYRKIEMTASLEEISSTYVGSNQLAGKYRLNFTPDLPEDMSVTVSGLLKLKYNMSFFQEVIMSATISQNGAFTTSMINNYSYPEDAPDTIQVGENDNVSEKGIYFNFDYLRGNEVIFDFVMDTFGQSGLPTKMDATIDITSVTFNDGFGSVIGLPLEQRLEIRLSV